MTGKTQGSHIFSNDHYKRVFLPPNQRQDFQAKGRFSYKNIGRSSNCFIRTFQQNNLTIDLIIITQREEELQMVDMVRLTHQHTYTQRNVHMHTQNTHTSMITYT